MPEPVQQSLPHSPPNPKPFAYTHTHHVLCWLLFFFSSAHIVLYCRSITLMSDKLSKRTSRKREIDRNRIAVCIAGETRTLYYPGVHKNILKRAIQPLLKGGYEVDVFFVIGMFADIPAKENKDKVYEVIKLFNATNVVEYTGYENIQNNFEPDRYNDGAYGAPKHCEGKERFSIRFSHALFRTQHCLDVISKHEEEHKFYYHWLYHHRPDIVFLTDDIPTPRTLSEDVLYVSPWKNFDQGIRDRLRKLDLNDTALLVAYSNIEGPWGVGDHFFSASRQVAQVALNAFDTTNDCNFYDGSVMYSESCLLLHLLKNKVPYAPLPVLWDIVRYRYDQSCRMTVQFVLLPNTTGAMRHDICRKFWSDNAKELPKQ